MLALPFSPSPHELEVKLDPAETGIRLEELCRDNLVAACLLLADGLSGTRQRAATFYDAACALGHLPSCGILGTWLYAGDGLPLDRARGKALLRDACNGGVEEACDRLQALGHSP